MPKQTNYEEEEMGGEEAAAMDMGGAAPMGSADYDASGRGSYDASGRGEQDAGTETIPDNIAMMNQASIAAKSLAYNPATVYVPQMGAEEVAEHVSAMFDGEDLSEEFVVKAADIFEAAVNSKINEYAGMVDESYTQTLTEQLDNVVVNLAEKVDEYLNYVVTEWMTENEVAVERGIKTDVAESFIKGLKGLFEAHYVDIPNERYDILDDLFEVNEQLQESLNSQINTNIQLNSFLDKAEREQIFAHYTQDLADTEIEKFANLAENVAYDNANVYSEKLQNIKEGYFNNNVPPYEPVELVEETTNQKISSGSNVMDNYVDAIAFQMRNK
tara:strand:+ start:3491 stop:4477 length:987 start_codon:yes stop_codon:yes gene_type:complete